jgi:hypothetical protein
MEAKASRAVLRELNLAGPAVGGRGAVSGEVDLYRDTAVRYLGYANEVRPKA